MASLNSLSSNVASTNGGTALDAEATFAKWKEAVDETLSKTGDKTATKEQFTSPKMNVLADTGAAGDAKNPSYGEVLLGKYDEINTNGGYLTKAEIEDYLRNNPSLSEHEKEALNYFLQDATFDKLDTAKRANLDIRDGNVDKGDIEAWISRKMSMAGDASYAGYLDRNPDADAGSKTIVAYTDAIMKNYDAIKDSNDDGKFLTLEDIIKFKENNPDIDPVLSAALDFWSNPGAFAQLDNLHKSLTEAPDGKIGYDDLKDWIMGQAPTDAVSMMTFLKEVATGNAVGGVDTSKLTKDIFENPSKYTVEERAAALQELLSAREMIISGAKAGMWKDDKSIVIVSNSVRSHPDPEKLLADVNKHIDILSADPEVVKYMNENLQGGVKKLLDADPTLKQQVMDTYEKEILSGKALDTIWETKNKEGGGTASQPEILAEFLALGVEYQRALGINDPEKLKETIKNSSHIQEFHDYYEKNIVSGDRLRELLEQYPPAEAVSIFNVEIALYNSALDADFTGQFDAKLKENFGAIAQENLFKDATFDELKKTFGVEGSDVLDEQKVRDFYEKIKQESPDLLLNEDGTMATADQVVAVFRGNWDMLRQGTKTADKLGIIDKIDPTGTHKTENGKGVHHAVSGLFLAGITIARGAGSQGSFTDKQIADLTIGSVQTVTLLSEGGMKNYQDYVKNTLSKAPAEVKEALDGTIETFDSTVKASATIAKRVEEGAKGIGGLAGIIGGTFGIIDSLKTIRNGDPVQGSFGLANSIAGFMSGVASAVEGGIGLASSVFPKSIAVPRYIPIAAGILGWFSAGISVIATVIPTLVTESKQEWKAESFGGLLSDKLTKYEIDGVEGGTFADIPEADWPKDRSGGLS